METGFRADAEGKVLPRDIIRRFTCRYNGELVFSAELFPAVAANPYLAFRRVATESGTLSFDLGGRQRLRADRDSARSPSHEALRAAGCAVCGAAASADAARADERGAPASTS